MLLCVVITTEIIVYEHPHYCFVLPDHVLSLRAPAGRAAVSVPLQKSWPPASARIAVPILSHHIRAQRRCGQPRHLPLFYFLPSIRKIKEKSLLCAAHLTRSSEFVVANKCNMSDREIQRLRNCRNAWMIEDTGAGGEPSQLALHSSTGNFQVG